MTAQDEHHDHYLENGDAFLVVGRHIVLPINRGTTRWVIGYFISKDKYDVRDDEVSECFADAQEHLARLGKAP